MGDLVDRENAAEKSACVGKTVTVQKQLFLWSIQKIWQFILVGFSLPSSLCIIVLPPALLHGIRELLQYLFGSFKADATIGDALPVYKLLAFLAVNFLITFD